MADCPLLAVSAHGGERRALPSGASFVRAPIPSQRPHFPMLSPRVFGFQGRGPPNPISSWRIVRAGGGAEPSVSTPGVWRPPASSPQPLAAPGAALQVQRGEGGGAMKPMSFEPFRAPGPSQPHLPSRVLIAGHSGAPGGPWEGADADVPGEVGVLAARTLTGGIHEASKCHLCGREKCARPSGP